MSNLLLKAFFLNPVLPILLIAAAVLGIILAYARGRKTLATVLLVEAVAITVYICFFLFALGPVLSIGASIMVLIAVLLLWRANLIQQDGSTIVVAGVFAAILLAAA